VDGRGTEEQRNDEQVEVFKSARGERLDARMIYAHPDKPNVVDLKLEYDFVPMEMLQM